MNAQVVPGTANPVLAAAVAAQLGTEPVACDLEVFPDGELRPVVGDVRGDDVYVIQPTGPPVNDNLLELFLLLDACRRAGADRLTAVVPYFGYARQDRRGKAGQAVGARVVADMLAASGADRLVVIDPHTAALEAICSVQVDMLTAAQVIGAVLRSVLTDSAVLVAPDLGAVKLAERYAALLDCQVVVIRKTRISGETVRAHEIVGDVRGRQPVIVDDMISTGATIEAAAAVLAAHGAAPDPVVAATHGPLGRGSAERMAAAGVCWTLVTDTTMSASRSDTLHVCSVAALLTEAIRRLHENVTLDDLLLRV
jgi:ribose-phosphate pyrophosphokinase